MIAEDCDERASTAVSRELDALVQFWSAISSGLTVIQVERTEDEMAPATGMDWIFWVGLHRLTRSEVEHYLTAKIQWAGSSERLFTPRAITRIHALSLGVPRGIERLAAMCLLAGASRGLEVVNPEVVDAAAQECRPISLVTSA